MKKIIALLLCLFFSFSFASCSQQNAYKTKPEITQIRSICNLATLECYYHNVAKSEKKAGDNISNWLEEDRKFWIEYTGVAKIGVDMNKVTMEISEDTVTIHMPQAKLLKVDILEKDLNEESYITSKDNWFNKNEITAKDQTNAINNAQKEMEDSVKNNTSLLLNARTRAEKLIENYIHQIGEMTGNSYEIKWIYEKTA